MIRSGICLFLEHGYEKLLFLVNSHARADCRKIHITHLKTLFTHNLCRQCPIFVFVSILYTICLL